MNTSNLKTANIYGSGMIGRVDLSGGATGGYYERLYYVKDHLGSIRVGISSVTTTNNNITYACDYYPFGETIREYTAGSNKYKFTEKERDNETSYDYFGARYYNNKLGVWLSVDPLADKYPGWSPYKYGLDNPVRFYDPDGKDEKERRTAIARAMEYVAANPDKSKSQYRLGGTGNPGKPVDCSAMVNNAVKATGLEALNRGNSNGVRNEMNQSIKMKFNDMQAGNLVVFGNSQHVAMIKSFVKNDNSVVTSITLIHSSNSYGPHETIIDFTKENRGESKYWKDRMQTDGVYKWDSWEGGTLATVEVVGTNKKEDKNESGAK
jgi:RHS repeat-associated protein